MSIEFSEVVALLHERRKRQGLLMARALDVREQYNGDVVIPLPELDRYEQNAVANLLTRGLDQIAMRSTSTQPEPRFPSMRPGFDKHDKAAADRRTAMLGFWDMNRLPIREGRQYRRFYGYGRAASVIVPDLKLNIPRWEFRDPLMTYPAPSQDPDEMTPCDCIFTYHQTGRWLKYNYPNAWNAVARRRGLEETLDELFEIVEYIDDEVIVLGVLGSKRSYYETTIDGMTAMELVRLDNRAGVCTAVVPGRVTLDKPMGMYDGMLGMYHTQSMLQALGIIATKRGIFKDQWLVARQGEIPRVVQMADGVTGELGIIQGGDIKTEPLDPSYMVPQMIDRIEQYQRQEAGIPEQMTGSGPTNSRTGRASDAILSATVDFTVQEAQKIMAYARQEEDKRAIAVDKGYFTGSKSFYVSWNGENKSIDYDPQELWETDNHKVSYSRAGVDENGLTIEIGQLLGLELIPKQQAREMHPRIDDPVRAAELVMKEGLESAVLSSVQQMASQPGAHYADVARIAQLVTQNNKSIIEAVMQVQDEAQKRQAAVDEQGQPATVQPGSPEAQPGLSAPGQGMEQPTSVEGPSANLQNLGNLFSRLRQPQMAIASERGQ